MIQDILTVMWKEWKGVLRYQGSMRTTILNLVIPVVMFGIFMPLQEGEEWVTSWLTLIAAGIVPLLLVGLRIPDSFAGERERHTLGTLLASRLPDRAILFGKVTVAVSFAWGVTLAVLLLGLVTVNVVHWDGQVMLYTPSVALNAVGLSLLIALLLAGAGVLVSLRAETVQRATQTLVFGFLIIPMILQMASIVVLQGGPEMSERAREILERLNSTEFILTVVAILVVIDLGLFAAAMARFQRSRLYLD